MRVRQFRAACGASFAFLTLSIPRSKLRGASLYSCLCQAPSAGIGPLSAGLDCPGVERIAMTTSFFTSYVAIWILVLLQGLLIIALLRELAELRQHIRLGVPRNDELAVGSVVPEFAGTDGRSGRKLDIHSLNEQGGVILFLSSSCSVCRRLVRKLQEAVIQNLPPIFVWCEGGEESCAEYARHLAPKIHFLVEGAESTAVRYHVTSFPTAVVVDRNRVVRGYGHPKDVEDLKRLVVSSLDSNLAVADIEDVPQPAALSSGGVQ
jgi:hypothetical protein